MAHASEFIREPARDIPVRGEYDVVVLGGGRRRCAVAALQRALEAGGAYLGRDERPDP
jgi:hypothetical protein